jgi:hypothetical protein
MSSTRRTAAWGLAALLGIALAAALTWSVSRLVSQRIGLQATPPSVAFGLAPRVAPHVRSVEEPRVRRTRHNTSRIVGGARPAAAPAQPPVTQASAPTAPSVTSASPVTSAPPVAIAPPVTSAPPTVSPPSVTAIGRSDGAGGGDGAGGNGGNRGNGGSNGNNGRHGRDD